MSPLSSSAIVTLDSALALLSESLENLEASKSVELTQAIEQLKLAVQSAGKVRESVLSELPETSWPSPQELDPLVENVREILKARLVEQQRSRLLALAVELERGTIVYRRALRVSEVNQLREQAVAELRAHAQSDAPPMLPGPAAAQWVEWACSLQEPQDAECLQVLQSGFPCLDHFVANLEPNTWRGAEPPVTEVPPQADTSHDAKPSRPSKSKTRSPETPVASPVLPKVETDASEVERGEDQSSLRDLLRKRRPRAEDALREPSEEEREQILSRERARLDSLMGRGREPARSVEPLSSLPDVLQKDAPRGFESNTLTPHDATPPRGEEEEQQVTAQERALLDGMMGLTHDPAGYFSAQREAPITEAPFHPTTTEPARATDTVSTHRSSIDLPLSTEFARETKAAGAAVATDALAHVDPPVARTAVAAVARGSAAAAAVALAPIDDLDLGPKGSLIEFPSNASATPQSSELDSTPTLPATSTEPIVRETRANAVLRKPGMLLVAVVLVLTALALLLWRPWAAARGSDNNSAVATPVSIPELKAPSPAPGNTDAATTQPTSPVNSAIQTTAPNTPAGNLNPTRESLTHKPTGEASSAAPARGQSEQALTTSSASPARIISVPKQPAAARSRGDAAIPVPSELANGASGSLPVMVGNIPAAVPRIANQGRMRISSGVAQGLIIHQVKPRYPQRAIQDHIQGTVVLQAVIAKDGSVQNIRAVSGNATLVPAAMDAVRQWHYKPYQLNGQPVETDTEINVKFALSSQ
jgi:TonB family protein